jgi:hypothetical protein
MLAAWIEQVPVSLTSADHAQRRTSLDLVVVPLASLPKTT